MKRRIKFGPLIAEWDGTWSCENKYLQRRLNKTFPMSRNTPGDLHIIVQAAEYFGGEVLDPFPPPPPGEVVY